eukprot:TRINITY_DN44042_c0_g1_i1.p2 TRINITY_DN44042_c0_g1~~TRINITY_DN44042_c0_g1_i1.p2  ORF type:complete len:380 (-),score=57.44 TRINITY_DN44042_c0_g1_i1:4-1143(-)
MHKHNRGGLVRGALGGAVDEGCPLGHKLGLDGTAHESLHTVGTAHVDNGLTMDFAVIAGDPKKAVVHMSGTHGVEGFVGSAIQTKFMSEWATLVNSTTEGSPNQAPTVVFVHAVNPFGFANMRRFNEANVDLNRNHLTAEQWAEAKKRPSNLAGYDNFRSVLVPERAPTLLDRYLMFGPAAYHLALNGFNALKKALVTGQYHDAVGVYYGGAEEQPSITLLSKVLPTILTTTADVIVVDVHSGLGPQGVDTFMATTQEEGDEAKLVWPNATIEIDGVGDGATSGYELVMGSVDVGLMLPKSWKVLHITEEFGTVAGIFVARGVILENAAFHYARGSHVHEITKTWLRDVFYPQNRVFKANVLSRGTTAMKQAVAYLRRK